MIYLKLSSCQFRGPIPDSLGNLPKLGYLFLQDNELTGTLPTSLSKLPRLALLNIFGNALRGTLIDRFNATQQRYLRVVQLNSNAFTGVIPDELFRLRFLKTVTLDNNCFHGSIPQTICGAKNLFTLSFNGLRSGSPCEHVLIPHLSSAYVLTRGFNGGVPPCTFNLPLLNTLHLSGNGLTGSLPDDVAISGLLIDLSLAHNRLTGTIPKAFQERVWFNLDLSYNKLRGTLRSTMRTVPPNSTVLRSIGLAANITIPPPALTLRNNRLSATIPSVLQSMINVSVVGGNLFSCDLDREDLPENDGQRFTYSCGSNSFNTAYFAYLVVALIAVCIVCALYYWRERVRAHIDVSATITLVHQWLCFGELYRPNVNTGMPFMANYNYIFLLLDELCKITLYCTVYIVFALLPLFSILNAYYRTHEETYAWSVSAAYLSGVTALVLMMFFTGTLVLAFLHAFRLLTEKTKLSEHAGMLKERPVSSVTETTSAAAAPHLFNDFSVYAVYALVNIAVLSAVNVAFVFANLKAGPFYKTLAQLALSAFKLLWSASGSQDLIRRALRQMSKKKTTATFFAVQLFVSLFNAIIVPGVVVAMVTPDCFYDAFVDAPEVISRFNLLDCDLATAQGCLKPRQISVQQYFRPPFTYSYECSASLITYYAPTFVYTGLIATFGNPCIDEGRRYFYSHTTKGSRWHKIAAWFASRVLRPVTAENVQHDAPYDPYRPIFDANYLLLTILTYLGILLTYGVVYPPLAVVMLVAIVSTTYTARATVGRFLSQSVAAGVEKYAEWVDSECVGVGSMAKLKRCGPLLVFIACCFYPLFMFDTLGDQIGADLAWVVFIVMPLLPVFVFGTPKAVALYRAEIKRLREPSRATLTEGIELPTTGGAAMTTAPLWETTPTAVDNGSSMTGHATPSNA